MTDDPAMIPDMTRLRAAIDILDVELATMLARRLALINRAAEIKMRDDLPARIDWRVEEVAANARRNAETVGLDPDLAEDLWRRMIEHAIAREETLMKETRP